MEKRALAHIIAFLTVLVWGVTFVSTKVLLVDLSPLQILVSRFVMGFVALCLLRPRLLKMRKRSHHALFAAAGATGVFSYYLLENISLTFADASFVSVAVSTAPLFTAALGFVILKEKGFGPAYVVGFALAMVGIALICFNEGPAHVEPLGVVFCLLAALSWAVYSIIVRKLSEVGYETIAMTKRIFSWGILFMLAALLVSGEGMPFQAFVKPEVILNLVFLGFVASAGCFVTWGFCVKHLGTAAASAYIYLTPVVTVVVSVPLLGDPFTLQIAFGIVLVLVGLALSEGLIARILFSNRRKDAS